MYQNIWGRKYRMIEFFERYFERYSLIESNISRKIQLNAK